MYPRILALGLAALCISAQAADLIPIEDFARPAAFSNIKLSPDGQYVGFIREFDGIDRMCFADVATMKMTALELGYGKNPPAPRNVSDFDWIGSTRLVLRLRLGYYWGGWVAVDRDRKNVMPLSGDIASAAGITWEDDGFYPTGIIHDFDDGRKVLVNNVRIDRDMGELQYPEVVKLDTRSGAGSTVLKNPGNVVRWAADRQGYVRIGITMDKNQECVIYRSSESAPWHTVGSFNGQLGLYPIGFSDDGKYVYIETQPTRGMGGVYFFDPEKKELGEPIWSDPVYEVHSLIREPVTRKLIGVRFEAECLRTKWLDGKYDAFQASVDAALPGNLNVLRSFARDGKHLLVTSYSDRLPPIAYLYDCENGQLKELGKSRRWIKSEQMAETHPVTYDARDGLKIRGYLTVPKGMKPKNLPLVVMPHGGPWARDEWGFDPLVQMLANRGYAVLQMDYRGSTGYGREFREKGSREVGGKIQDDIDDATRWAIAKRIADPKRIAIVGASYGGYSALFALGKSADLYCCGVSFAGVTDWLAIYDNIGQEFDIARRHWSDLFGDPKKEKDRLKAISPVSFASQITAPVLIIQGEDDKIVPPSQARAMISALKAAGRPPESLFIADEGHSCRKEKGRLAEYKAIEAFLAKHLGAAK